MTVQRYIAVATSRVVNGWIDSVSVTLTGNADGDLVKYHDYAQLEKDLAACRSELSKWQEHREDEILDQCRIQFEQAPTSRAATGVYITALQQRYRQAEQERDALKELVQRFAGWDMLDSAADGPFWKRECAKVLDKTP